MMQNPEGNAGSNRWKWRAVSCVGLFVLCWAGLQFWIATPGFFEAHVLPGVRRSLAAEASMTNGTCIVKKGTLVFTAQEAKVSGFSTLVFRNCQIAAAGQDPPITIGEVRLGFGVFGLFDAPARLRKAIFISPALRVLATNDNSNLDPMVKALQSELSGMGGTKPEFSLESLEVRNGSIQEAHYSQGPEGMRQDRSRQLTMSFTSRNITPESVHSFLTEGLPSFSGAPAKSVPVPAPPKNEPVK